MKKLTIEELYGLEKYAVIRAEFRDKVIAHKKNRVLNIGPHAALFFEDRLTMQYQVQEMLRAERIFEAEGIEEELKAYNPLIPDGSNWKATFMIQYADENERKQALEKLIGIEDRVWVRVNGYDRVWAIADEDMERESSEKTSAVHFLRFELTSEMVKAAKENASISMGIEHEAYTNEVNPIPESIRVSLVNDLD